jgi:hypothetical protein
VSWPQPTRQAHDKFCKTEEWERVRDARGRTGTHHVTYELALHDGRILRTRVSHPVDRSTYGASMWSHILRSQLDVTEEIFWHCVQDGVKPQRGKPVSPTSEPLPAEVVHLLINRVGLHEDDVAKMTKNEAIERLNQFWADGA